MALRIVEQAGRSDVGRQRNANEDSLVLGPPFFAVADGMGGARAGEVASRLAADSFGDPDVERDEESAEAQLTRILQTANRRIYQMAAGDETRRGMGTTTTAAKVHGSEVSLGHVGDSRAYLLRDGKLEQLTRDHSLVAELERTGQITAEAAENHPQRSIITRALGPEPDVEVDTLTVRGRPGDVFLLCSDGLTGMIGDDDVAAILRGAKSLDAAAAELVEAANQSGGKDNITAVLFRLGDESEEEEAPAEAEDTIPGTVSAEEVRAAAPDATFIHREPLPVPPRPRKRAGWRPILGTVVAVLVLGGVVAGLYGLSRQVWFLGTDDAGLVTLYRGIPYELPLGIDLYEAEYASAVPARAIPAARRSRVLDHEWRSRDDAIDLLRALERGELEPGGAN